MVEISSYQENASHPASKHSLVCELSLEELFNIALPVVWRKLATRIGLSKRELNEIEYDVKNMEYYSDK